MQFNGPVFLHPPKTGGSSIINALIESNLASLDENISIEDFLVKGMHKTFSEYNFDPDVSYAISVRSPYTRYVSAYYQFFWFQKQKHLIYSKDDRIHFNRFKRYMLNNLSRADRISFPCSFWIEGITGTIQVIKFENLVKDVKHVYGINLNSFSKISRKGLGTNYSDTTERETLKTILPFYDDAIINIINNFAGSDFENFGYTKFKNYQQMVDYVQD